MNQLLLNYYWLVVISTGILGLVVGSFLNVVIYRLPIMLQQELEQECSNYIKQSGPLKYKIFNLINPRSHCPKCATPILWWQNLPLISYFLLVGKCDHCQNIIHWHYPLVELLSCVATIFVAVYFNFNIKALLVLTLTWIMIVAIFIDLEHQLLPDNITLPAIWLGLLSNTNHLFATPTNAIIGAASGYLLLWIIAYIFKLIRKTDGMGYGDFKLLAVFGAWLGWQLIPIILFAASLIGGIVGIISIFINRGQFNKPIAFGPYLAITGWLAFFWGQNILNWYLGVCY